MNISFPAAILVKQNQPLIIDEISFEDKLCVGQVLVKLDYSGICGSQLGEIAGAKGPDPYLPHLLGHEGSGTVVEVGPGVSTVHTGDRVVLHWRKGSGIEGKPPKYKWQGKIINAGHVTTFNAVAVVSENRVTSIPPGTNLKAAALLGCAITTGFGVITNDAELKIGENIVVFGAGGVGLNIIQGAKLAGANKIIAVDQWENRLELAKKFGATSTINVNSVKDLKASVLFEMATCPINVTVDNTGKSSMIKKAYELISKDGRVILVGVPQKGDETTLYTLPMHFGKRLIGSEGGATIPERDIPKYINLIKNKKLEYVNLISSVHPLRDINTVISRMKDGTEAGRALIKFDNIKL
jgi:S-(hydroxymethyl)glutathione dehydrogenase/alcohol dehydrogenase